MKLKLSLLCGQTSDKFIKDPVVMWLNLKLMHWCCHSRSVSELYSFQRRDVWILEVKHATTMVAKCADKCIRLSYWWRDCRNWQNNAMEVRHFRGSTGIKEYIENRFRLMIKLCLSYLRIKTVTWLSLSFCFTKICVPATFDYPIL